MAIIYKTLYLPKELRLKQELGFEEGSVKYDPNTDPHINIICTKCGKILDYSSEKFEELWSAIVSGLDINPKGQRIDVYYECNEC